MAEDDCSARCPNPRARREKASKTMQFAKKGSLLLTPARAFCRNHRSGAGSEGPEQRWSHKFIRYALIKADIITHTMDPLMLLDIRKLTGRERLSMSYQNPIMKEKRN